MTINGGNVKAIGFSVVQNNGENGNGNGGGYVETIATARAVLIALTLLVEI